MYVNVERQIYSKWYLVRQDLLVLQLPVCLVSIVTKRFVRHWWSPEPAKSGLRSTISMLTPNQNQKKIHKQLHNINDIFKCFLFSNDVKFWADTYCSILSKIEDCCSDCFPVWHYLHSLIDLTHATHCVKWVERVEIWYLNGGGLIFFRQRRRKLEESTIYSLKGVASQQKPVSRVFEYI